MKKIYCFMMSLSLVSIAQANDQEEPAAPLVEKKEYSKFFEQYEKNDMDEVKGLLANCSDPARAFAQVKDQLLKEKKFDKAAGALRDQKIAEGAAEGVIKERKCNEWRYGYCGLALGCLGTAAAVGAFIIWRDMAIATAIKDGFAQLAAKEDITAAVQQVGEKILAALSKNDAGEK